MSRMRWRLLLVRAAAAMALGAGGTAWSQAITMASTTSTEQSGLFGALLPQFKRATGIAVKVVAVGTGQAIDMARRGDADVLFVHDQAAEEKFVADGGAVRRYPVMYNDFVLIGPKNNAGGINGTKDIVAALKTIKAKSVAFISRGDKSGTHAAELALWKVAGIDIAKDRGPWYKEIGQGMGAALNTAQIAELVARVDEAAAPSA